MIYEIEFSEKADLAFQRIKDRRVKEKIFKRIQSLREFPELQGQPLANELVGYRSVRAVGQRYRIIYRILDDRVVIIIFWVGLRREGSPEDVYSQATKLIKKTRRNS